jgi:hypothetical protein
MDEIRETLQNLSLNAGKLTSGQLELVKDLDHYYSRYKTLSEKQKKELFAVRNSLQGSTSAVDYQTVYNQDSGILFLIGYIRLRLKQIHGNPFARGKG